MATIDQTLDTLRTLAAEHPAPVRFGVREAKLADLIAEGIDFTTWEATNVTLNTSGGGVHDDIPLPSTPVIRFVRSGNGNKTVTSIEAGVEGQLLLITWDGAPSSLILDSSVGSPTAGNTFYSVAQQETVDSAGGAASVYTTPVDTGYLYSGEYLLLRYSAGGWGGVNACHSDGEFLRTTLDSQLAEKVTADAPSITETNDSTSVGAIADYPLSAGGIYRFSAVGAKTLSGIVAPASPGRRIVIVNDAAAALTIDSSGGSASANKFVCVSRAVNINETANTVTVTSSDVVALAQGESIEVIYSAGKWRAVAPITKAGTYTP